jgi:uncharacterized protein (TIGR00251 family)
VAAPGADWLTRRADGVRLAVKVTPRAARAGVQGVTIEGERSYLAVRVAAPADGDKANTATLKLLARHCGVAPSALSLVSGASGRRKLVDVQGDAESLTQRLNDLATDT